MHALLISKLEKKEAFSNMILGGFNVKDATTTPMENVFQGVTSCFDIPALVTQSVIRIVKHISLISQKSLPHLLSYSMFFSLMASTTIFN
jgi:hypothetical protein